jgi:hypothetical protein
VQVKYQDHPNKKDNSDGKIDDDDESNLINKDDFDERKNKEIITARATPIKHNALAKKNLNTTNRKPQSMCSPSVRGEPGKPINPYY